MKKLKIFLIIISILILFTIIFFSIDFSSKYCELDTDCKSKSGCNVGCWSKIPRDPVDGICPFAAGPIFCLCHQNKCTDASFIRDEVDKNRLINACNEKDYCKGKIDLWLTLYTIPSPENS